MVNDPVKQFLREFYSPMQHWRIMKFIDYMKAFLTSWKSNNEDRS